MTRWRLLRRSGAAVLLTATLVYAGVLVLHPGHGYVVWRDGWLANLALALPGVACLLHAVFVRARRMAAIGLGLGMLAFAFGNIAYVCSIRLQVEPPVPSLADVGYLGFYPLALAGALAMMRRARKIDATLWLDGVLGAVGAATALAALLNPVLAYISGPTRELLVAGAYPVGDLLLIAMLAGSLAMRGPRDGGTLSWLALGLLCFCAADVIYALRLAEGSYAIGTPLDALWSVGMTIMALALWRRSRSSERGRGSIAVLAVPLISTLAAVGVLLWATSESVQPLTIGLAVVTLALAATRTAVAFQQLQRLADARRQARTDDLTGLQNRRGLQELATARPGTLLLLDLDGFKEINDVLGHGAGDTVLREIAARLTTRAHPDDVVARLGGDEFALLLGPASGEQPELVAKHLLERVGEPLEVGGITMRIGASIGIAVPPEHGTDLAALLRHADIAMYEAKRRHSGAERYASEFDRHTRDRLQIRQDLDRAFEQGEFTLHFQPKCDARTGEAVGVEALVRWQHPERGLLFPDAFLTLIEQRGQTSRLTETVLALAASQAAEWRTQGIGFPIAVNLTAADLLDASLPARVRRLLEGHELPTSALELEITESLVLTDPESATRTLARLRALGIAIAVDDYGTGYSSLSHLRDLPIDQLKIDRSFVTELTSSPRTAAIVRSTIELAHALELRVVAEGVEDLATLRALAELGCDWVQGYLFTKPLPPASLVAWNRVAGFVADLAGGGDQHLEGERDRAAVEGSLAVQDA